MSSSELPTVTPGPTPAPTPAPTTPSPVETPTPAQTPAPTTPAPETPTVTPGPPEIVEETNPQADGDNSSSGVPYDTRIQTEDGQTQYELYTSTHFTDTLEVVSSYYSSGYQDFADAVVQLKEVKKTASYDNPWSKEIVKDAVNTAGVDNMSDLISLYPESITSNIDLGTFLEETSTDIFKRYMEFGNFAMELEAIVAIVESILRENLSTEEYNEVMSELQSAHSIDEMFASSALNKVEGHLKTGATLRTLGLLAKSDKNLMNAKDNVVIPLKKLKELIKTHVFKSSTTAKSAIVSKSKIGGALGFAALYFGATLINDIVNDQVTLENELFNAARAGVILVSGYAAASVSAALAGTAAGSWAGPIGAAVGLAVSLVGHYIVDSIEYLVNNTFNGMPRLSKYEEITVDQVREMLKEQGIQVETPKIGNESAYDVIGVLTTETNNEKFVNYMLENSTGLDLVDSATTEKYDRIAEILLQNPNISMSDFEYFYPLDEEGKAFFRTYKELFKVDNEGRLTDSNLVGLQNNLGESVFSRIEPRFDIPPYAMTPSELEAFRENPYPVLPPPPPMYNQWVNP